MQGIFDIPLHLAVHVSGLAVAAGLMAFAVVRRDRLGTSWLGLTVGGGLLAVSHLVLGGLLADGAAWPLYLRAAGYAALAVGAAGRVMSGPAAVLVVPAGGNLVAAVAGALAAAATVGGVLGRGRAVIGLSLAIALWAVGDYLAVSQPTVAAVLSLAGSVAGLVWLAGRAGRSLATRFVTAFGAVLLAVVVILASAAAFAFDRDLRQDRLDLLGQQAAARAVILEEEAARSVAAGLAVLTDSTSLPAALADGGVDDATAAGIADIVRDADLLLLLAPDGRVVGSFDRATGGALGPAETSLAGAEPVATAIERLAPSDGLVRLELEATGSTSAELLAVAAQPLFQRVEGQVRPDLPAGVVVGAQRVTRSDRLEQMSQQIGAEVAVLAGGDLAASTTGADTALDQDLETLAGRTGGEVVELSGRPSFATVSPLTGVDGSRVGSLVLFEDASVTADLERLITRALFVAAVLGGLLATGLAATATSRITRPIRSLTTAAERIARGDHDVDVPAGRRDEVGRLAAAFGHMADVVEQRERDLTSSAEREARARERLEGVTVAMSEGLVTVGEDGRVVLANPAAQRILGVAGDPIGQPLDAVLHGVTDDGRDLITALGGPGDRHLASVQAIADLPGGQRCDLAVTAAPLMLDEGQGRVFVFRDVTSEAQLDRAKTEFLANASHELNTPLTPIIGYVDTLARLPDLDTETRVQFVGQIQESAERLRRVVSMLVDFAELEAGRAQIKPVPTDVGAVIDDTLDRWRGRHPDRTYRRRVARALPRALMDPIYTGRVLDELLDNATKFSSDTVVVAASSDEDGRVRIEVRDRGIGIDVRRLEELTSDFRQADASATRHYGGLGLGLAIVERILRQQDGHLEVGSRLGHGSHVAFTLPAAPS